MKEVLRSKGEGQNPHKTVNSICNQTKRVGEWVKQSRIRSLYAVSMQSSPKPLAWNGMDTLPRGFKGCSNTLHPLLEYPGPHSELSLNIN